MLKPNLKIQFLVFRLVHLEGQEASGLTVEAEIIPNRLKTKKKGFCFIVLSKNSLFREQIHLFLKAMLYCNMLYCHIYYSLLFWPFQINCPVLWEEKNNFHIIFRVSVQSTSSFMTFASSTFQQAGGALCDITKDTAISQRLLTHISQSDLLQLCE